MSLRWQISTGRLLEWLLPFAFALAALLSTFVLWDARRARLPTHLTTAAALGTLAFAPLFFPLYLLLRLFAPGPPPGAQAVPCADMTGAQTSPTARGAATTRGAGRRDSRRSPAALPLLYLAALLAAGALLFCRDYHSLDAHLARAADARLRGQRARAIAEYRAALRLEDSPHTRKLLGIELAAAARHEEAAREFRAALAGGEPDDALHFHLAQSLDLLGSEEEAADEYLAFARSRSCNQPLPDRRCAAAGSVSAAGRR